MKRTPINQSSWRIQRRGNRERGKSFDNSRPRILVGICSSVGYKVRRDAVRQSWFSSVVAGIDCQFFVGGGLSDLEPDVVSLPVQDTYEYLPAKVKAYFQHALKNKTFDWLFKCDDDTYIALDRLHELLDGRHELVGNEFVNSRGAPSGGAGYLLSRRVVELLANDPTLPDRGAEDIIVGEAAIRLGALALGTRRLCWDTSRCPSASNDIITAHWCSPEKLLEIHTSFHDRPFRTLTARHPCWVDQLVFYNNGRFKRANTSCHGKWRDDVGGAIHLGWFGWDPEVLVPEPTDSTSDYRVMPLREFLSNQPK